MQLAISYLRVMQSCWFDSAFNYSVNFGPDTMYLVFCFKVSVVF